MITDLLQVDSLTERVEELKQDKKRLVEEYEAKLSKVGSQKQYMERLHVQPHAL